MANGLLRSLLLLPLLGCVHRPSAVTDGDQFQIASRGYPQLADRGDTILPPRQPLAPCRDQAPSDWVETAPTWPSAGMPPLRFRVPADWHAVDLAPAARMARQSGAAIDSAAHLIGIWESPMPGASLRLATDSMPGYQLTIIGGKSRQREVEECGIDGPSLPGRIVVATVEGQNRDILFVALWRLDDRHWLKASARARNSADSLTLRGILASVEQ